MTDGPVVLQREDLPDARFYLILQELSELNADDAALAQEIEEIEEISRMIQDVADDHPCFMTST